MSNTTKQRLSVGAVLIGLLGFGVLCFTWSTMPPPEASASPAATAALTVAQALPVAATPDPTATAALEGLTKDYEALTKLAPTSENIEKFGAIVTRAEALIAGGKLTIDQYVAARRLLVDALDRQGRYNERWTAFREYLTGVERQHNTQWAVAACRREANHAYGGQRYHDALEGYAILAERWPDSWEASEAMHGIASCYHRLGDGRMTLGALKLALANYPDSPRVTKAYPMAAAVAMQLRDVDEAIRLLKEYIGKRPVTPGMLRAREDVARMYVLQGKTAEAIATYQEAREKAPFSRKGRYTGLIQMLTARAIQEDAK